MRKLWILLLMAAFGGHAHSQTTITLNIEKGIPLKAKLYYYKGKHLTAIDSCIPENGTSYRFNLSSEAPRGVYRIILGKHNTIDLLVTNEPQIVFNTIGYAVEDSLKVTVSEENKLFYRYLKLKRAAEQQHWLLESLLKFYPKNDPFRYNLLEEQQRVKSDFYQTLAKILGSAGNLFACNYINLDTKPFIPGESNNCRDRRELSDRWWDGVDLTDTRLLNTPILVSKLWDYLENLLCEESYTMEKQDSLLVTYIDKLLRKPIADTIRNRFTLSLAMGFGESNYFGVIRYLLKEGGSGAKYIETNPELMARIKIEENLLPGKKGYNFTVKPPHGKKNKLSRIKSRYTLIVFWSVWCPHCTESMPLLARIYREYHNQGLEIVGINIDEEEAPWLGYLKKQQLPWINMQTSPSSNNPIIIRYNVDETPKLFLLDETLTIVSRPGSPEQLHAFLKQHL